MRCYGFCLGLSILYLSNQSSGFSADISKSVIGLLIIVVTWSNLFVISLRLVVKSCRKELTILNYIYRGQRTRSVTAEGVYNNAHFMHSATLQIGNVVRIKTASGIVWEGKY